MVKFFEDRVNLARFQIPFNRDVCIHISIIRGQFKGEGGTKTVPPLKKLVDRTVRHRIRRRPVEPSAKRALPIT
jgi:hypothetical protein